jgi:hypothetical protein
MISAMMRWVSILGVSIKKLGDRIVAASMPRMAA